MSNSLRLGDQCVKIGSGSTPRGGYKSYVATGVPLIRSQNVLMRSFSTEGLVHISHETHAEMGGTEVRPGDILLNITGASIGRVCVVPAEICPANVNQHVCIIRCGPHLCSNFVATYLSTPVFQRIIMDTQAGGTRQALTKSDIEDFTIPDLPFDKQQRLSTQLRSFLDEIEKAERGIKVQLAESLLLGNSIVGNSLREAVPRQMNLGGVLEEVKDGVGSQWRDLPVLGATRNGMAPARERPGKTPERYKPVTAGTVFYNPMRILIGSIAFVDDDDKAGITSPDYVVLKGKPGVLDSRWFYYWLRSPWGERCIQSLARGAVRERMLFNRLAEGEIELPDYETQLKASRALAQIKPMRTTIQKQLRELKLMPQKLLSQEFGN